MHLLAAKPGGFVDDEGIVDLNQTPADIVILSAQDTSLGLLADVAASLDPSYPSIRLANLANLVKPAAYDPYERYVEMAAKEELALQEGSAVQYVVYGHTHWSQHVPLAILGEEGAAQRPLHYVNVGSLRPTHQVTRDGRNFYETESLCFGIFYRADERQGATEPTFELHSVQRSHLG